MLKKLWIGALCLLLCGCSPAGVDPEAIRSYYAAAGDCAYTFRVATSGAAAMTFELRLQRQGDTDLVTILAPEGVAGISARVGGDRTLLEYRGAVAETLLPGVPGFTPCDGLTGLLDDLAAATPASCALVPTGEGESILLSYLCRPAQGMEGEKQVWLTPDYRLQRAEFFLAGSLVMTLEVK